MNLERFRLSEMTQTQEDKNHFLSHMCIPPCDVEIYAHR